MNVFLCVPRDLCCDTRNICVYLINGAHQEQSVPKEGVTGNSNRFAI